MLGIRNLPARDLTYLQASPAECNTIDGKCLTVSMELGDEENMVIDDPQEIPCDEIICDYGFEPVRKPEGCQCFPQRRPTRRPRPIEHTTELSFVFPTNRPQIMPTNGPYISPTNRPFYPTSTQRPIIPRIDNAKAKQYLFWLHDFRSRRRDFVNKVMGRI